MSDEMIYLDNAATTAMKPEVFEAMKPYFMENYGNPSSVYRFAGTAKKAVEDAREEIAKALNAKSSGEIYFTAGGSEADNWAIKAAAESFRDKGRHIITTKIEHHAVLHTAEWLERNGYEVTYLDVDEDGLISLEELEQAIRPDTILMSIMFANNEIGTIEPVKEIGLIAGKHGVLFHTDAVQAFGHVPIDVQEMNIDMLSASAHKLHGPKGIGFLYLRNGIKMGALIHGGAQERSRRAGTHNVSGIAGFAEATRLAMANMEANAKKETEIRDYLISRIENEIPYVKVNGHREKRLPNNVNVCFRFIEGESLLILLDQKGICASSGSACTAGSLEPSHVLMALGLPPEVAHGSIRFTLSEVTTREEIDFVIDKMEEIVAKLRDMSPFYDEVRGIRKGKI